MDDESISEAIQLIDRATRAHTALLYFRTHPTMAALMEAQRMEGIWHAALLKRGRERDLVLAELCRQWLHESENLVCIMLRRDGRN